MDRNPLFSTAVIFLAAVVILYLYDFLLTEKFRDNPSGQRQSNEPSASGNGIVRNSAFRQSSTSTGTGTSTSTGTGTSTSTGDPRTSQGIRPTAIVDASNGKHPSKMADSNRTATSMRATGNKTGTKQTSQPSSAIKERDARADNHKTGRTGTDGRKRERRFTHDRRGHQLRWWDTWWPKTGRWWGSGGLGWWWPWDYWYDYWPWYGAASLEEIDPYCYDVSVRGCINHPYPKDCVRDTYYKCVVGGH